MPVLPKSMIYFLPVEGEIAFGYQLVDPSCLAMADRQPLCCSDVRSTGLIRVLSTLSGNYHQKALERILKLRLIFPSGMLGIVCRLLLLAKSEKILRVASRLQESDLVMKPVWR